MTRHGKPRLLPITRRPRTAHFQALQVVDAVLALAFRFNVLPFEEEQRRGEGEAGGVEEGAVCFFTLSYQFADCWGGRGDVGDVV